MKPIIFSGPMVTAILDGRKTQTRRVVKFPDHAHLPDTSWIASVNPDGQGDWVAWGPNPVSDDDSKAAYPQGGGFKCPYGRPGDLLWVRETFVMEQSDYEPIGDIPYQIMSEAEQEWSTFGPYLVPHYRATEPEPHIVPYDLEDGLDDRTRWSPSRFMPKWASRIHLAILNVRVERLQDISSEDAELEGVEIRGKAFPRHGSIRIDAFIDLWDSINAKRGHSWAENPWVWVLEFKRIEEGRDGRVTGVHNGRASPDSGG